MPNQDRGVGHVIVPTVPWTKEEERDMLWNSWVRVRNAGRDTSRRVTCPHCGTVHEVWEVNPPQPGDILPLYAKIHRCGNCLRDMGGAANWETLIPVSMWGRGPRNSTPPGFSPPYYRSVLGLSLNDPRTQWILMGLGAVGIGAVLLILRRR